MLTVGGATREMFWGVVTAVDGDKGLYNSGTKFSAINTIYTRNQLSLLKTFQRTKFPLEHAPARLLCLEGKATKVVAVRQDAD